MKRDFFVANPDKKRTILTKKSFFQTSGCKQDQCISSAENEKALLTNASSAFSVTLPHQLNKLDYEHEDKGLLFT